MRLLQMFFIGLALLVSGEVAHAAVHGEDCVSEGVDGPKPMYETVVFEGRWTIYIAPRFEHEREKRDKALALIEYSLQRMEDHMVPERALAVLHATPIWLELKGENKPSADGVYHPSRGWLCDNNMNSEKAYAVQFSALIIDEIAQQPAMVLHEFAHAYHDKVLGYGNADVVAAYKRACSSRKYSWVEREHFADNFAESYALQDQTEFFAEMSETYFWQNDFQPYDRSELERFDPETAALMRRLWYAPPPGPPVDGPPVTCGC